MAEINIYLIVIASVGFDLLTGDPIFLLHPVQIIGIYINKITNLFLSHFKRNEFFLFLGGLFISFSTISGSYLIGKFLEIKYFHSDLKVFWGLLIIIGLSSCLACKNLISSVKEIFNLNEDEFINKKKFIIEKVQRIVSRDVRESSVEDLLRSATESLTENSVDGIFAPLFYIFLGTILIKLSIYFPGPLSLGYAYEAISTLDSMIGYKHEPYTKLGFASAKIEDFITFIPCRIVVLTLPLLSKDINKYFIIIKKVFNEGSQYESPNSGLSEGIFAHVVNIKLGGKNKYKNGLVFKPILNSNGSKCNKNSINEICKLILKLNLLWILIFTVIYFIF